MLNYLKKLFGFGPKEQEPVAPYKVEVVAPIVPATAPVVEAPKTAPKAETAPAAPKAPRARKTAKPAAEKTAKPKAEKTAKPKTPRMTVAK